MKPLLLTFDVEEFDLPSELGRPLPKRLQVDVAERGVHELLPLLARHEVRATFFVTGRFARARPETTRAIARAGHEVAAHGLLHRDDYARMDAERACRRLARARRILESVTRSPVRGVRTPRLRPCAPALLREAGFAYDATPHPTWVPGRYSGLHWPRSAWREEGVVRVPISVLPFVRAPVSFLWYRWAGASLGPILLRLAAAGAPYLHLYFHSWETQPVRRLGVPPVIAARTGAAFLAALDRLLGDGAGRFEPMCVAEYVASLGAVERSTPRG
jgi:peptidoglycan/xylan/chitin deacetylase (PgdA/CDA1 family)